MYMYITASCASFLPPFPLAPSAELASSLFSAFHSRWFYLVVVLSSFHRHSRLSFTFSDYVFIWSCYATFLMSLSTGKQSRRAFLLCSTSGPEEHWALTARSIGIHIRMSKWWDNIFYPRAKPLSRYSKYVSTWYVYSISVRFTVRLVDSIFSIRHRIDLIFCNWLDNIFGCQKNASRRK